MAKKVKQAHGGAVNQFVKGESGNPKGRPKKSYGAFLDRQDSKGYEIPTKTQFMEMVGYLMVLTEEDMKREAKKKDNPLWIRSLIMDMNKSSLRHKMMADYRDWIYGKPDSNVKLDMSKIPVIQTLDASKLSPEQLKALRGDD